MDVANVQGGIGPHPVSLRRTIPVWIFGLITLDVNGFVSKMKECCITDKLVAFPNIFSEPSKTRQK